jgi:hypothetical protein
MSLMSSTRLFAGQCSPLLLTTPTGCNLYLSLISSNRHGVVVAALKWFKPMLRSDPGGQQFMRYSMVFYSIFVIYSSFYLLSQLFIGPFGHIGSVSVTKTEGSMCVDRPRPLPEQPGQVFIGMPLN